MVFAILRGKSGRRHDVNFGDAPVEVDVAVGDKVVQITVEATRDMTARDKKRFVTMTVPREQLMAALGLSSRKLRQRGEGSGLVLVSDDEE